MPSSISWVRSWACCTSSGVLSKLIFALKSDFRFAREEMRHYILFKNTIFRILYAISAVVQINPTMEMKITTFIIVWLNHFLFWVSSKCSSTLERVLISDCNISKVPAIVANFLSKYEKLQTWSFVMLGLEWEKEHLIQDVILYLLLASWFLWWVELCWNNCGNVSK